MTANPPLSQKFVWFGCGQSGRSRLFQAANRPKAGCRQDCLPHIFTATTLEEQQAATEPAQIERPGSPSITCWRSKGRSPGFQSGAVWTTR